MAVVSVARRVNSKNRKNLTTTPPHVLYLFMSSTPEMAERHGRVLAELAEFGLELARDLKARALAAPAREDAEGLALAFHRVSRSVRLTLALESRLVRERQEAGKVRRAETARAVQARKAQVQAAVSRQVYDERESDEAERLLDELDERLEEAALYDTFAEDPVEACIARIRADLGLPPAGPANDRAQAPGPAHSTGPPFSPPSPLPTTLSVEGASPAATG
jgi:hypothetical protein